MGMPAVITYNGTSNATSAVWFADWMQTPFSVSFAAVANSTASYNVEYTLDNIDIGWSSSTTGFATGPFSGVANATTIDKVTWFQSTVSGTTITASGSIAAPVRAMRVNIVTAAAIGSSVTITFMQATFGR